MEYSKGSTWNRQEGRKEEVRLKKEKKKKKKVGSAASENNRLSGAVRPARSPVVLLLMHEAADRLIYGVSIHIGHILELAHPLQTSYEAGFSPPNPLIQDASSP